MADKCTPFGGEKFEDLVKQVKKNSEIDISENEAELIAKNIIALRDKISKDKDSNVLEKIQELKDAGYEFDEEKVLNEERMKQFSSSERKKRTSRENGKMPLADKAKLIRDEAFKALENTTDLDKLTELSTVADRIVGKDRVKDHEWEQQEQPTGRYNIEERTFREDLTSEEMAYKKDFAIDNDGRLVEVDTPYNRDGSLDFPIFDKELAPRRINATFKRLGKLNVALRLAELGDEAALPRLFADRDFMALANVLGIDIKPLEGLQLESSQKRTTLDKLYEKYKDDLETEAIKSINKPLTKETESEVEGALEVAQKIDDIAIAEDTLKTMGVDTSVTGEIWKAELDTMMNWEKDLPTKEEGVLTGNSGLWQERKIDNINDISYSDLGKKADSDFTAAKQAAFIREFNNNKENILDKIGELKNAADVVDTKFQKEKIRRNIFSLVKDALLKMKDVPKKIKDALYSLVSGKYEPKNISPEEFFFEIRGDEEAQKFWEKASKEVTEKELNDFVEKTIKENKEKIEADEKLFKELETMAKVLEQDPQVKAVLAEEPWKKLGAEYVKELMEAQSNAEAKRIIERFGQDASTKDIKMEDIHQAIVEARRASEKKIARSIETTRKAIEERPDKIAKLGKTIDEARENHVRVTKKKFEKMRMANLNDYGKLLKDTIRNNPLYFDPNTLEMTDLAVENLGNILRETKRKYIEGFIKTHVPDAKIREFKTINLDLTQDQINDIVDNLSSDGKQNIKRYFDRIANLDKAVSKINRAYSQLARMSSIALEKKVRAMESGEPMTERDINEYSNGLAEKEFGMRWDTAKEGLNIAQEKVSSWTQSMESLGSLESAGVPERNLILKEVSKFIEKSYARNAATYTKTAVEKTRRAEYDKGNRIEVSYDDINHKIDVVRLYDVDGEIRQQKFATLNTIKDALTVNYNAAIYKDVIARNLVEEELKNIHVDLVDNKAKNKLAKAQKITLADIDALEAAEEQEAKNSYIEVMGDVYKKVMYNKDMKKIEEFMDKKYKSIVTANFELNKIADKANNEVSRLIEDLHPDLVKERYVVDAGLDPKANRDMSRAFGFIHATEKAHTIREFRYDEEIDAALKSQATKEVDAFSHMRVYANDNVIKISAANDGYGEVDPTFLSHTYRYDKEKDEYHVGRSYDDVISDNFTAVYSRKENPEEYERIQGIIQNALSSSNNYQNLIDYGIGRKISNSITKMVQQKIDSKDIGLMATKVDVREGDGKKSKLALAEMIGTKEIEEKLDFDRNRNRDYRGQELIHPGEDVAMHYEQNYDARAAYYAAKEFQKYMDNWEAEKSKKQNRISQLEKELNDPKLNKSKKQKIQKEIKSLSKELEKPNTVEMLGPSVFDSRVTPYRKDVIKVSEFVQEVAKIHKIKDAGHMAQVLQLVSSDMTGRFNNLGSIVDWDLALKAAKAFAEKGEKKEDKTVSEKIKDSKTKKPKEVKKPKGTYFDSQRVFNKQWVMEKVKPLYQKIKKIDASIALVEQQFLSDNPVYDALLEGATGITLKYGVDNKRVAELEKSLKDLENEKRLTNMHMNILYAAGTEAGYEYILAKMNDKVERKAFNDGYSAKNPLAKNSVEFLREEMLYWEKVKDVAEKKPGEAMLAAKEFDPNRLAKDKVEAEFEKESLIATEQGFEGEYEGVEPKDAESETREESPNAITSEVPEGLVDKAYESRGEGERAEKIAAVHPEFVFGREETIKDVQDMKETDFYEASRAINSLNFGRKINMDLKGIKDYTLNEAIQNYDSKGGYNKVNGTLSINTHEDLMNSFLDVEKGMNLSGDISSFENAEEQKIRKLMSTEPAEQERLEGYEDGDVETGEYCKA